MKKYCYPVCAAARFWEKSLSWTFYSKVNKSSTYSVLSIVKRQRPCKIISSKQKKLIELHYFLVHFKHKLVILWRVCNSIITVTVNINSGLKWHFPQVFPLFVIYYTCGCVCTERRTLGTLQYNIEHFYFICEFYSVSTPLA